MRLDPTLKMPGAAFLLLVSACAHAGGSIVENGDAYEEQAIVNGDSTFRYAAGDPFASRIAGFAASGHAQVEAFWNAPFPAPVNITLAPDRLEFESAFPSEWGMSSTQCWMVGVGVADFLVMLSPAAWADQACEHDPADEQHIRDILVHELAHVYHGQRNPTRDFTGAEEIGWFAEGVAVLVAGQLDRKRLSDARDAVEEGAAPDLLVNAWSGPYRYGVAGSIARYIDQHYGRSVLFSLLPVTTQDEFLNVLGTTEEALLQSWKRWVLEKE